ncbi:endolytic transglycosylase MltG [Aliiglaciecola sp. LCG003]|uniref:endolytic transglycosylase MltG n=1 Tax=Aliiglaciecola sp. LCG003 TaxID=3053655 RepID=UPI0025740341|nr:endolytic transglycosylase MltG [Aliiglaciecola sp. LCG003]WJG07739.1 endolytic transglycosylase MltG [Aliiglaciecola sp. LCG003]
MFKMLKWLSALVLIAAICVIVVHQQVSQAFNQSIRLEGPQLLIIKRGQYAHFVINRLAEQSLLEKPLLVKMALKLHPELSHIKSGTYEISPGMSVKSVFQMLQQGKEKTYQISLVEGLRWRDWLSQLNTHSALKTSMLEQQEWLDLFNDDLAGNALEGWLLPDTYQFTHNTKVEDIVLRAHQAMNNYLQQAWQQRASDLPYDDPYQALIMASIIEKETGVASERPRIAGVFVNRLRKNMRLQTDPTVIYGIGDEFDGNIRRRDLKQATPYNTYVIKGLPPTPIAMPSKLSIDAALHPLDTQELYFVSKGDGTHQFSRTLTEHNQAVRIYQLKNK